MTNSASLSSNLLSSSAAVVVALTNGLDSSYHAIVTTVASWGISELLKLGMEELTQMRVSISHFIANIKAGVTWGQAMASMLTEVWNNTKSDLAGLATDFVEAVGKLLQNAGLITVSQ